MQSEHMFQDAMNIYQQKTTALKPQSLSDIHLQDDKYLQDDLPAVLTDGGSPPHDQLR